MPADCCNHVWLGCGDRKPGRLARAALGAWYGWWGPYGSVALRGAY